MVTRSKKNVLFNALEAVVREDVENTLRNMDVCKCDRCFNDICAIVLNAIKPMYSAGEKGELFVRAVSSMPVARMERMIDISKAIKIVSNSPLH